MELYKFVLIIGTSLVGACQAQLRAPHERSAECFEYGYDYSGYDIHHVDFVVSPAACMKECAAFRSCGFWTYDTFSRICYLKSAGAFIDRKPSHGLVSGPRQCSFSSYCFEVGIDYYGHDVDKVEGRYVMTPLDCQRLCTGNPECAFFSWKFSTHSCFLKSSSAILDRREDPDVTSGPRTCSGLPAMPPRPSDFPAEFDPSTAPPPCVEANVEYRGHNIRTAKTKSAAGCHAQCLKLRDCQYWTWSSQSHVCGLKNEGAPNGRAESQNTLDKVSGAKNCVPVTPGCQFANVGVVGARLSTRTASAFDVCQFYCAVFSGCTNFSHDLATGECTLWSSFDAYSEGSSTQGIVSGPAFCDAEETCFEQSDYAGHNVEENETGEVESPAACQALCRNNSQCYYWTWLQNNKGCYLKDANAVLGRTNDTTSLGRFSGPKWCTISFGCVSVNATYTGVHIQHAEADDYKACSVLCGSNPFCTAWTFHSDLGLCSLFSGQAALSHKPVRGALSGEKACGASAEQDQSCFEDGILYSLDKILGIGEAKTAFDCFLQCQANVKCHHWSLKNGENCFLLAESKDPPSFVFDPNSISGPRICPSEVRLTSRLIPDLAPMATAAVYSENGCMNKCAVTPGCKSWMLSLGKEMNCSLFESVSTSANVAEDGNTSYGELLPLSMVATKCTFSDPLGSLVVSTPSECFAECQANESCEAWQVKLQAASSSMIRCTLFSSAEHPTTVKDSNTLCGTAVLPSSLINGTPKGVPLIQATLRRQCINACAEDMACVGWRYTIGECAKLFKNHGFEEKEEDRFVSGHVWRHAPSVLFNTSYAAAGHADKARVPKTRAQDQVGWMEQLAYGITCMEQCKKNTQCTAWTWHNDKCEIFTTAMVPTTQDGAVSGLRSSVLLSDWQFDYDEACGDLADGEEIPAGPVPLTVGQCAQEALNKGKQHFSFGTTVATGPPECYIFSDKSGLSLLRGYICGSYQNKENQEIVVGQQQAEDPLTTFT